MKSAIRFFALFVAFAGLASASFAPANRKPLTNPVAVAANGADPTTIGLPAPLPCQLEGSCFVSGSQTR
jgi:hypothetical protein